MKLTITKTVEVKKCADCPYSVTDYEEADCGGIGSGYYSRCKLAHYKLLKGAGVCVPDDCPLRVSKKINENESAIIS